MALSSLVSLPLLAQSHVTFSGSVRAGEHFTRPIGRGLTFELAPGDGWEISIRRSSAHAGTQRAHEDMSRCVTGPLHGPSPLRIEAWRFLPRGGETAWEKAGDRDHGFEFTLNSADQTRSCTELGVIAETVSHPDTDPRTGVITIGTPGYKVPPTGRGDLTITKIQLSKAPDRKEPFIESMSFNVAIQFPIQVR